MVYMLTFTINIPQMLAYIPAPWILWVYIYMGYSILVYSKSFTVCIFMI